MPKIYAIMSGKGGVGKSTISTMLSLTLSESRTVLLLDFDISGPSQKFILNSQNKKVLKSQNGLVPITISPTLDFISMASLIKDTDSVIWRGPKKQSLLNMFWNSITDKYDAVVIDMPPGLSEEHRFLADKNVDVVIVTTPQNIALDDTAMAIEYCFEEKIRVSGLIENMSGFRCGNCGCETNIFAKKGGQMLAEHYGIPFVGFIDIDTKLESYIEEGILIEKFTQTHSYDILKKFIVDFKL